MASSGDNPRGPSLSDPSVTQLSRRTVLKGVAGVAGLAGVSAFLAACGAGATTAPTKDPGASAAPAAPAGSAPAPAASATGQVTIGSNNSDPAPKKGMQLINTAFTQATGVQVVMNTVDHNTFQDQISAYLQGTPQDTFLWFSGHRMRFFADQGLVTPVDDVWASVKNNFTSAFATAVTGNDGKVYGIPIDYYPWAVFYRKSVFAAHNYQIPATWTDLMSLCKQMQKDGLIPFAFGDKDGWPAMGTFDILDLRLNGYDFHIGLLNGKEKWTDPRVTAVFNQWKQLLPYSDTQFAGLTWEQSADKLIQKKAGMYLLGLFVSQEFVAAGSPADLADLDFFAFPALGTPYDAEKALDAPIDVIMMSAKSRSLQQDMANAKAYLQFWSKGSTQLIMFNEGTGLIPPALDTDTSGYTALDKKAVEIVNSAKKITQFLDRDSRPDFAGANGMQSFLAKFLANPNQDLPALQKTIQNFWDSLPPEA
jgi:multiple sugar transport system substrate-binding protein